jgi:DNA-binding GntR family transcriptional regulator
VANPADPKTTSGRVAPLSIAIYERLRDGIVNGAHAPGTVLVQEQLALELGTSRTPVRDALNRLAQEGLVEWNPGNGYAVLPLSDATISHVYEVRERLETLALSLACGRLDRVAIAKVSLLIEEMKAADSNDAAVQYELNRRFHQQMMAPCENPLLLKILDDLWDHPSSRLITREYIKGDQNVQTMVSEHEAMLQATINGDVELLLRLTAAHMSEGYDDAARQMHQGD